jgi:hypothetical protein
MWMARKATRCLNLLTWTGAQDFPCSWLVRVRMSGYRFLPVPRHHMHIPSISLQALQYGADPPQRGQRLLPPHLSHLSSSLVRLGRDRVVVAEGGEVNRQDRVRTTMVIATSPW